MREKKKHKSVETAKRRKWCSTVLGNLDSLRPRRLYTIIVLSFSLTVALLLSVDLSDRRGETDWRDCWKRSDWRRNDPAAGHYRGATQPTEISSRSYVRVWCITAGRCTSLFSSLLSQCSHQRVHLSEGRFDFLFCIDPGRGGSRFSLSISRDRHWIITSRRLLALYGWRAMCVGGICFIVGIEMNWDCGRVLLLANAIIDRQVRYRHTESVRHRSSCYVVM